MNTCPTHYAAVLFVVLVCAFNLGCGNRDETGPPELHLGSDVCDFCVMIISDQNFAAACIVRTPDGRTHTATFDDIGCLLAFDQARHDSIEHRYVTDFDSGEWLDADGAFYIQSPEVRSPMASGILASQTQAGAELLAGRFNSYVLRFDELGGHADPSDPASQSEEATQATQPTGTAPMAGDQAAPENLE